MASNRTSTIAKNTLMLYVRMAFTFLISLYTSRIVLDALGVDDYGISNVVGGVIAFFGFIIYSMQTAIQRFLTVAMGENDMLRVQHVFSIGLFIHVCFALVVVLLGETVGLWFVLNKLVIPDGRLDAAVWIYHFCVAGCVVSLLSIPYTAEVVAHEKMGTFAYLSILNVVINLGIAFLLLITPLDRLVTYGFLGLCANVFNQILYVIYCKRKFSECKFTMSFPRQLFKEMLSFAGWDFFGVVAFCVSTQGATIMLNMYFGTAVNAARAIAQTALDKIKSFSNNFTLALNPAISKAYGAGDFVYMEKIMFSGSKLIFFLFFTLALPVFVKTPYLMKLWLGVVPDYTVAFVRVLLFQAVFLSMWNPLFTGGLATGKIKEFGLKTSICNIVKMPVCYIILFLGGTPLLFVLTYSILEVLSYSIQLFTTKRLLQIDLLDYIANVQGRAIIVMCISLYVVFIINGYIKDSLIGFLTISLVSLLLSLFLCSFILINDKERKIVKKQLRNLSMAILKKSI